MFGDDRRRTRSVHRRNPPTWNRYPHRALSTMGMVRRSDALVSRHVQNKHSGATERDLNRVRHVELARLHDRGHWVDELTACVARLADRREHVVDLLLFHPRQDRGMRLLEESTLRVKPRHP